MWWGAGLPVWGDNDAAERDFSAAVERAPNAAKPSLSRRPLCVSREQVDKALADYETFPDIARTG